jgi:diadenosine tetraphosphate (Ap4A) HIT family hydrolase/predicted GNAT family N-acyltransferase
MLIRAVTKNDCKAWLALAHEADEIVGKMIEDTATFYEGFDEYMESKIKQNEAFIAEDRISKHCLGIVSFSQKNNRITYLQVAKTSDYQKISEKLMEAALNQLDKTKEISVNVIKSDAEPINQERKLYKRLGFIEDDKAIFEAGVPACSMKRPPSKIKKGYSFHHDYPGYMEWMDESKCPFCNNEPVLADHILIKELDNSFLYASMKAQGLLWGKCVVLSKKHYIELDEIPPQDLTAFMAEVQKITRSLKEVSGAVKINLELHGNTVPHLHIHLFPRYLDDLFAGKAIDFTKTEPSPYESEAEFDFFIEQMRLRLSQ